MRYINLHKYNTEFAGKTKDLKIFYNPDNTVAIFDEGDERVWDYIIKNGEKLKESRFFMNEENYESIQKYIVDGESEITDTTEIRAEAIEELDNDNKKRIAQILKKLGENATLPKVRTALTDLLKVLSQ